MAERMRFAILASGRGSNAAALMDAFARGAVPATLAVVISNREDAPVLARAETHGVPALCVQSRGLTRDEHEAALLAALTERDIDHLLLAGYMRILSRAFLRTFGGRVLNIHPSLLPEFPGLQAARRQWEAKVPIAGATVHLVDEGVDTGPPLLMGSIEVRGDEGAEGLTERILTEVEHVIYPRAVRLFIDRMSRSATEPQSPLKHRREVHP